MGGSACIAAPCCYVKRKESGWLGAVYLPLGTVLYGPNPEPANNEKRFRLELFYTEINN